MAAYSVWILISLMSLSSALLIHQVRIPSNGTQITSQPVVMGNPPWNFVGSAASRCSETDYAWLKVTSSASQSSYLHVKGLNFSIPDNYPIASISVSVTRSGYSGTELRSSYHGIFTASEQHVSSFPQVDSWIGNNMTFHNIFNMTPADWRIGFSRNLTGADINSDDFGVLISVAGAATARLYCVSVDVMYQTPEITSAYLTTEALTTGLQVNNVDESSSSSEQARRMGPVIGASIGGAAGLLGLSAVAFFLMRRRKAVQLAELDVEMNKREDSKSQYGSVLQNGLTEYLSLPSLEGSQISKVVNYDDLHVLQTIGSGAFGVVSKALYRNTYVAIKQLVNNGNITERHMADFITELQVMLNLKPHPNVVGFIGVCASPTFCLVIEYMEGGSLIEVLQSNRELPQETLAKIVRGCAAGIQYLHQENCTHRDIAARNILLDKDLTPKISDFGLARMVEGEDEKKTVTFVGPLRWMAPESINNRKYSKRSDVWSFGILLIEVYTRSLPFPEMTPLEVATKISHFEMCPEAPSDAPKAIQQLVSECCRFDPNVRPDAGQICVKLDNSPLF
eukprot:TRINITY_DN2924_c0_g3_i1.p1 TRINITY_DN2924_c0_g3~~TRINITY_DN2924_c0_g3_i1.p1  ORF type:complete len:566 (-),score=119.63 TRINITY_DN2924_c0_g3_i1:62-1759(-)